MLGRRTDPYGCHVNAHNNRRVKRTKDSPWKRISRSNVSGESRKLESKPWYRWWHSNSVIGSCLRRRVTRVMRLAWILLAELWTVLGIHVTTVVVATVVVATPASTVVVEASTVSTPRHVGGNTLTNRYNTLGLPTLGDTTVAYPLMRHQLQSRCPALQSPYLLQVVGHLCLHAPLSTPTFGRRQ